MTPGHQSIISHISELRFLLDVVRLEWLQRTTNIARTEVGRGIMVELYRIIDAVEDSIQEIQNDSETALLEPAVARELVRLQLRLIQLRSLTPFFGQRL